MSMFVDDFILCPLICSPNNEGLGDIAQILRIRAHLMVHGDIDQFIQHNKLLEGFSDTCAITCHLVLP